MINFILNITIIAIISYLAGSFPTSIIVGKLTKGIDIRNYGSKNAGGTNSFRVLGIKAGILVCSVDIFKGFAAAFWISQIRVFNSIYEFDGAFAVAAGVAAVLGHCYTIFADFKGGKGVAAAAGILIALFPTAFIICLGVFTTVLVLSGYVSLSSISTAIALPIVLIIYHSMSNKLVTVPLLIFGIVVSAFVIYSHRSNIERLIKGNENRFKKLCIFERK